MALDFGTYSPKGLQERIAAHQRFEKLFLGQHNDLYLASLGRYRMVRYIVANFAGLISWLSARPGRSRWAHRTQLSAQCRVQAHMARSTGLARASSARRLASL